MVQTAMFAVQLRTSCVLRASLGHTSIRFDSPRCVERLSLLVSTSIHLIVPVIRQSSARPSVHFGSPIIRSKHVEGLAKASNHPVKNIMLAYWNFMKSYLKRLCVWYTIKIGRWSVFRKRSLTGSTEVHSCLWILQCCVSVFTEHPDLVEGGEVAACIRSAWLLSPWLERPWSCLKQQ